VVAAIAQKRLSPLARQSIRGQFGVEQLPDIALWADQVKADKTEKKWHYTNIAANARTYDQRRDCPDFECVTEKIRQFARDLAAPQTSRRGREEALKYLVHLVADIHQPLHLGNAADRGGNGIEIFFKGEKTNLHALWDHHIAAPPGRDTREDVRRLPCRPQHSDIFTLEELPVEQWSNESRALALDHAYVLNFAAEKELPWDYIHNNRALAERQLCRAGVRLAKLLNLIFAGP
jgi:hypothetical protein